MDPEYPPADAGLTLLDTGTDPRILPSLIHIALMLNDAAAPYDDLSDWSAYPAKVCLPDEILADQSDLARFLGGDASSFTGDVLSLIAKARFDPENLNRLARGFPRHVAAWVIWHNLSAAAPLTAAALHDLLQATHSGGDGDARIDR